jgi:hypothetical protein
MQQLKAIYHQRPTSIANMTIFEGFGAIGCLGLLLLTPFGSRDFFALLLAALLGFVVVYSLWTLQSWSLWFTTAYEMSEICYESYLLLTQPEYHQHYIHMLGPIFGILMSILTIGFIVFDRSFTTAIQHKIISQHHHADKPTDAIKRHTNQSGTRP